jgi:hypothetical protein
VGSDPPLDQIAHGTYFGEGPVWDRRKRRDQVTVVPARRRRADEFASAYWVALPLRRLASTISRLFLM